MKKQIKNVLITGATSDMAIPLIEKLLADGVCVYAASRSVLNLDAPNLFKFYLDVIDDFAFEKLFFELENVKFDSVVCFQGVAIVSPVEYLSDDELKKQLDISLFSLLKILKKIKGKINKNGTVINLSSMASFGIFPFLSPYSIAKASSDILLNCYEIETGIKTVSIKPGVVSTKFWKYCINENKVNFPAFKDNYRDAGEFLKNNALKNSTRGISPEKVSNFVYKVIYSKAPKTSYTIGIDSKITNFASLFKGRVFFSIIRAILNKRVKEYINEK